ncbi:DUF3667 domain-containing protein [Paraburkholderia caffeinilytica]|uniref:DUF3667 domain-containing protein n=1 Tax=Paraburkholderia caffeinilytica TaxID=1761016 RepID=UPI003DA1229B
MMHMVEDVLDTVWHVDERIFRTISLLLIKPGLLTREYLAGRRQPYIAPFRLVFILSLFAFFLAHIGLDVLGRQQIGGWFSTHIHTQSLAKLSFDDLRTPAEVQQVLDRHLAELHKPGLHVADQDLGVLERDLRDLAAARIAVISGAGAAAALSVKRAESASGGGADVEGTHVGQWLLPWVANINWLPSLVSMHLSRGLTNLKDNLVAIQRGGVEGEDAMRRFHAGLFGALPLAMFLMIPVFALLLKLVYVPTRRWFYVEHVIIALHSHAFLFFVLCVEMIVAICKVWAESQGLSEMLSWIEWSMAAWVVIYLLIMQKRIYSQSWRLTIFKYLLVGCGYMCLLGFTFCASIVVGIIR